MFHIRGSGGRIALRPDAWKPATGMAFRNIIDDAGCLQADAARVVVAREVNCLLGAEAQACLSIDCLAIEAMAVVESGLWWLLQVAAQDPRSDVAEVTHPRRTAVG
jgi:hypothetical protein